MTDNITEQLKQEVFILLKIVCANGIKCYQSIAWNDGRSHFHDPLLTMGDNYFLTAQTIVGNHLFYSEFREYFPYVVLKALSRVTKMERLDANILRNIRENGGVIPDKETYYD